MTDAALNGSQEAPKHPGGRPLKFESVGDLQIAINAYFDACDPHIVQRVIDGGVNQHGETIWLKRAVMTEQEPYTVSGLARALGISRQALLDYGEREEFIDTVAAAKERCHEYAEKQLFGKAQSGAAFSLKNNWGWKDRQEIDHTTDGQPLPSLVQFIDAKPTESDTDTDTD